MTTNRATFFLGGLIALGLALSASAGTKRRPPAPKPDAMVDTLMRQLQDPEFTIRRGAARGLGRIGAAAGKAVPLLTEASRDARVEVRDAAELALSRIEELTCVAMVVADGRGR